MNKCVKKLTGSEVFWELNFSFINEWKLFATNVRFVGQKDGEN